MTHVARAGVDHAAAPPIDDDAALAARLHQGDPAAFEQMFRHYYPPLCSFAARQVRLAAIAEELVQDVFRQLWERRGEWHVQTTLEGYLYRAVRNRAIGYRQHQRVEAQWSEDVIREQTASPAIATDHEAPDAAMVRLEQRAAIDRAIQTLPPKCREIFLLKWAHELGNKEIAELLGLSVKTVEMQITRGFRMMREQLTSVFP